MLKFNMHESISWQCLQEQQRWKSCRLFYTGDAKPALFVHLFVQGLQTFKLRGWITNVQAWLWAKVDRSCLFDNKFQFQKSDPAWHRLQEERMTTPWVTFHDLDLSSLLSCCSLYFKRRQPGLSLWRCILRKSLKVKRGAPSKCLNACRV